MCKQIADVGGGAELLVLGSSVAWSHLIVCRQVGSYTFRILSSIHL